MLKNFPHFSCPPTDGPKLSSEPLRSLEEKFIRAELGEQGKGPPTSKQPPVRGGDHPPQEGVLFKVRSSSCGGFPNPGPTLVTHPTPLSLMPELQPPAPSRLRAAPPKPYAPRPGSAPTPSHLQSSLPAPLPDSCLAATRQPQPPSPRSPKPAFWGRWHPRPAGFRV